MNEKDQEFGSDAQLEKHAREYHGLSLAQFKLMCEEAHKRYEGQFSSSVDKALAVDSFYEGFKVAIKEALERPAQEPVAWIKDVGGEGIITFAFINEEGSYPVYTHPAQQLSDDEIEKLIPDTTAFKCECPVSDCIEFARAIEQAHGIGVKDA